MEDRFAHGDNDFSSSASHVSGSDWLGNFGYPAASLRHQTEQSTAGESRTRATPHLLQSLL
jgi:hypothetical protein